MFPLESTTEQLAILEEGLAVKKECRLLTLSSENALESAKDDEVLASLMADLIRGQLAEADSYIQAFVDEV